MQPRLYIALLIALVPLLGCGEIHQSWEACAEAAESVHRGDAEALCGRFSEEMLAALPCDAVDRVLRQTVQLVGEPVGKCGWAYTYRVRSIDPVQARAVYKCPFARQAVKVTVSVEVTEGGPRITGLWSDAPSLRAHPVLLRFELCRDIHRGRNACIEKLSQASWDSPRIAVWNQWQNLRGGDRVAWGWFTPSGQVVADFDHHVEESPPFDYRTWAYIEPAKLAVENPYGTWTVKLALNGKELEAFPFEVVR